MKGPKYTPEYGKNTLLILEGDFKGSVKYSDIVSTIFNAEINS